MHEDARRCLKMQKDAWRCKLVGALMITGQVWMWQGNEWSWNVIIYKNLINCLWKLEWLTWNVWDIAMEIHFIYQQKSNQTFWRIHTYTILFIAKAQKIVLCGRNQSVLSCHLKYLFIGPRDLFIGNRKNSAFTKKGQPPSIRHFFRNKPFGVVSHVILLNFQFPLVFDGVLDCFILILLVLFNNSEFVLGPRKYYCKRWVALVSGLT